jgi:S-adenosylmethionine-dependent methyltransferase
MRKRNGDWKMTGSNLIEDYYDSIPAYEWGRRDRHRMEFALSLRAILDVLPPAPGTIADIGGGPGRYSIELARKGYAVTLADLSSKNLEFAREKAAEAGVELDGYVHANALDLKDFADQTFDAVLLMGPLYHLVEEEERLKALQEARRCLKPGGLLFAAVITRFSIFRDAAYKYQDYPVRLPDEVEEILRSGRYPGDTGFTRAYFMHPDEVIAHMENGGFQTVDMIGCEGFVAEIENKLIGQSEEIWRVWENLNYRLCREPSLRGAADHLLYIGRK